MRCGYSQKRRLFDILLYCEVHSLKNATNVHSLEYSRNEYCQTQSSRGVLQKSPPTFLNKRLWHRNFDSEFCEIFKNIYFYRTAPVAASK